MTETTTAADVIDWPKSWDADAIAWVKRQIIGEYLREAEARQPDASALRTALEPIDDAIQYAIAFMNDPEGLAASREQWRDQLRTALHDLRAFAALPEPK